MPLAHFSTQSRHIYSKKVIAVYKEEAGYEKMKLSLRQADKFTLELCSNQYCSYSSVCIEKENTLENNGLVNFHGVDNKRL